MPEDPYGTTPMFEVPPKYRRPAPPDKPITWRKYVGRRTSCDDCILAIIAATTRFAATPASYIRITADRTNYYCREHAAIRRTVDDSNSL